MLYEVITMTSGSYFTLAISTAPFCHFDRPLLSFRPEGEIPGTQPTHNRPIPAGPGQRRHRGFLARITSYNVCYTKLLRGNQGASNRTSHGRSLPRDLWRFTPATDHEFPSSGQSDCQRLHFRPTADRTTFHCTAR